ncbi:MAG: hypothetical protein ACYTEZ_16030 [Planctomycetota bacterium]
MSTRALAWTAALLYLLLLGAGTLLLQRLGYLAAYEAPTFVFTNHTLAVRRGQRVVVRPLQEGASWVRYTFTATVREPDPDDALFVAPHAVAGMEDRKAGEDTWYFKEPYFVALGQMGALTSREWLEEIRLVRERTGDGRERTLLRARYGHESGSTIFYYADPDRPVPVFGWFRTEMHAEGREPEVYFARGGGRIDLERGSAPRDGGDD